MIVSSYNSPLYINESGDILLESKNYRRYLQSLDDAIVKREEKLKELESMYEDYGSQNLKDKIKQLKKEINDFKKEKARRNITQVSGYAGGALGLSKPFSGSLHPEDPVYTSNDLEGLKDFMPYLGFGKKNAENIYRNEINNYSRSQTVRNVNRKHGARDEDIEDGNTRRPLHKIMKPKDITKAYKDRDLQNRINKRTEKYDTTDQHK